MTPAHTRFFMQLTKSAINDVGNPIWLGPNIDEFKRHAKTRFHQDNFVDSIEFDYLEIHINSRIKDFGTGDFFAHIFPFHLFLLTLFTADCRKRTQSHCPKRREISRHHSDQHRKSKRNKHQPYRNIRNVSLLLPVPSFAAVTILIAPDIAKLTMFPRPIRTEESDKCCFNQKHLLNVFQTAASVL